jgi:hypothetical protein
MGRFLERTWERPSLLRGFVVVGLLTMYTLNFSADLGWLRTPQSWPIIRREVNIFLLLAFGPFLAVAAWPRPFRPLARLALIGCLVTFTVLGCRYVVEYEELADSYKDFDKER